MNRISWDEYFLILAKIASLRSTCNSRHNGCVIVKDKQILSLSYNGALPGKYHCIDKNNKYCFRRENKISDLEKQSFCIASHAESNAISLAAKFGISLNKSIAYCTLFPCYNCLKTMCIAGVNNIIYEYEYESCDKIRDKYWKEEAILSGINFKQLKLEYNIIKIAKEILDFPTAKRLLK